MIRPLRAADKDPVMELIRETGMFTAAEVKVAEELVDFFLNRREQKDYRIEVLEEEDGAIVAYVTWGPTPLTDGTFDLYWIAVSPRSQGKGYGTRLMRWVEDKIKEDKGRVLIIETSSQPMYEGTRQFYLKQQYQEVVRIAGYYKPGDDRVIYAKYFA
ncbi:MAG TPA: GNAT family N-acetyltransferase [bacterium]|nr:GNAT family N-acetyltransferase [bacterium]HQI47648.1 GNAT family N-acetyltransferase [bacterium]HQJ63254.1 GNAT family N-acetyltransferase [bacterium]